MNSNENEHTVSKAISVEASTSPHPKDRLSTMLESLGHVLNEPILVDEDTLEAMSEHEFKIYVSLLASELPARKEARNPFKLLRTKIAVVTNNERIGMIEREEIIHDLVEKFLETDEYYRARVTEAHKKMDSYLNWKEYSKITPP